MKIDLVILAGGRGTRLQPITDTVPKTLVPVIGEKTILDFIFDSIPQDMVNKCIVVTHYMEDAVKDFLDKQDVSFPIETVRQEELTGTWTALLSARDAIETEMFLVINGDDVHNTEDLCKLSSNGRFFGLKKMKPKTKKSIDLDDDGNVTLLRETREDEETSVTATGAYVLDKGVFDLEPVKSSEKEYGLPHTLIQNHDVYPMKGFFEEDWHKVNTHEELEAFQKCVGH